MDTEPPPPGHRDDGTPPGGSVPGVPSPPVWPGARAVWPLVARERLPRVWWIAGPVLALTLVAVVLAASVRLPYISLAPGSARSVESLVAVKGRRSGLNDDILFLTVSVRRTTGIEAFLGWLDDDVEVDPEKVITGGQSENKSEKFNQQLMTTSKETATKVALEKLGYKVVQAPAGAVVTDVDPRLPVFRSLTPGDTVIEADGRSVQTSDDLVAILRTHRPGDTVKMRVRPLDGRTPRAVSAFTVPRPGEPQRAILGISLETRQVFHFPIKVSIDSGRVGGPSAGLAFTLAVLDRLTPGRLTGGQKVAVTGTINADGLVGPVGGVHQKTIAAIRAGAKFMLVPPDEYRDARDAARGRLRVMKVASLDEALRVLAPLGGNAGTLGKPGAQLPTP